MKICIFFFKFSDDKRQILYTGRFLNPKSVVLNPLFVPFVQSKEIDEIYADLTAVNIKEFRAEVAAINDIQQIMK